MSLGIGDLVKATTVENVLSGFGSVLDGVLGGGGSKGIGGFESALESFSQIDSSLLKTPGTFEGPTIGQAANFSSPLDFLKAGPGDSSSRSIFNALQSENFQTGEALASCSNNLFGGDQGLIGLLQKSGIVGPEELRGIVGPEELGSIVGPEELGGIVGPEELVGIVGPEELHNGSQIVGPEENSGIVGPEELKALANFELSLKTAIQLFQQLDKLRHF